MGNDKEELFFVNLKEPNLMRRAILEGSRDALKILQISENLKDIRIKKVEKVIQLKSDMRELNRLINKLKADLPKVNIRVIHKEKPPVLKEDIVKDVNKKKKIVKKAKPHKLTKLEKLEDELGDIERKLGTLR